MVFQTSSSFDEDSDQASLDFSIFHISGQEAQKILFEENLQLINGDGYVIDKVTISVELNVQDEDEGIFEVYQYSQDESLMLRTKSHVTQALETLSEVRKIKQNETEKLVRITNLPETYRLFMVETDLEQRTGFRINDELLKSQCEPFVLEGANVILLRKLALSRLFGEFTVLTVNNDGVFGEAQYKVEDLITEVRVTRVVGEETMTTMLNSHGRILHHRWSSSQWRLDSGLPRPKSAASRSAVSGEPEAVEQGAEAEAEQPVDLAAYWQRKQEVIQLLQEYMVEHSNVQDMMADLMKNILFEKPDDPIDFADKYLSEFLGITRDAETEEIKKTPSNHN